jgi:hypothetical protein
MTAGARVGLGFWFATDLGFVAGVITHRVARYGWLVWIGVPIFEEPPSAESINSIAEWRWPIFYPAGTALNKGVISPVGMVEVPQDLRPFPSMRCPWTRTRWLEVRLSDDELVEIGATANMSLPILKIVNHTELVSKVTSGWQPTAEVVSGYLPPP